MPKTDPMAKWVSDIDTESTEAIIEELQRDDKKPWDKIERTTKRTKHYRRICPKRPDWPNPYEIRPVHYLGPHDRMVLCLKEAGLGECPGCLLRIELDRGGDKKMATKLRPSIRTFLNVVKIDEEGNLVEEKVFLLGLNKLQFLGKHGVEYDLDDEDDLPLFYFFKKYGDLSHVETGRGIQIKAKGEKSGDFDTTVMKFAVADPSPFPGSSDLLEEELVNLSEVVEAMEPSDMVSLIEGKSPGALAVAAPADVPKIVAPKTKSLFHDDDDDDDDDDDTETPAVATEEEDEEETPKDARASGPAPKTDPSAAIARLHETIKKNGG